MEFVWTLLVFVVLVPPLIWVVHRAGRAVKQFLWGFVLGRDGLDVIDLIGVLFLAAAGWLICVTALQVVARIAG